MIRHRGADQDNREHFATRTEQHIDDVVPMFVCLSVRPPTNPPSGLEDAFGNFLGVIGVDEDLCLLLQERHACELAASQQSAQ
jgi:hypothetical protein